MDLKSSQFQSEDDASIVDQGEDQINYKIIIVGNSNVGKTSTITRFALNSFNDDSSQTKTRQV